MNFLKAVLAWAMIALILGYGLWSFTLWLDPTVPGKGSPWIFIVAVLGFIVAVGKIGCKTH